jgi:hypothetical protein
MEVAVVRIYGLSVSVAGSGEFHVAAVAAKDDSGALHRLALRYLCLALAEDAAEAERFFEFLMSAARSEGKEDVRSAMREALGI